MGGEFTIGQYQLPVPSSTLVAADNSTIQGNGSGASPLKAIDGSIAIATNGTLAGDGTDGNPLGTVADKTAVAVDGTSIVGNGTTGSPLAAVGGPSGAGNSDGVTLQGTGLLVNPYAIKAVQHSTALSGNGTVAVPLDINPTVVAGELAGLVVVDVDGATIGGDGTGAGPLRVLSGGLAGLVAVATDGTTIIGNGLSGNPLIAVAAAGTTIYFNVKAPPYNAVGNGAADDTTAIRSAIAAALAVGGGTIYFPNGTYKISEHLSTQQCLSLPGGVSLLGQSRDGAELFLANAQPEFTRMVYVVAGSTDLSISNLTLNGNASGQSGANIFHRDEIFLDNTARITISECTLTNGFASGIVVWQNSVDTLIEHCLISGNVWQGVAFGDAGGQQNSTVRDCHITGNAGGLHIETSNIQISGVLWDHCYVDATSGNAALEIVGDPTGPSVWATDVIASNCTVVGAVLISNASNCTLINTNITCSDTAPTPQPAVKIMGGVDHIVIDDCPITLTSTATSTRAIWIAANNTGDPTADIQIIGGTRVNVQNYAIGIDIQNAETVTIGAGVRVIGNASMTPYVKENFTADHTTGILTTTTAPATGAGPFGLQFATGGSIPTGTSQDTPYWAINLSPTTFELATSLANALANVPIAFSTNGSLGFFESYTVGIKVNAKNTRTTPPLLMDVIQIEDVYIADFPQGITAQGGASADHIQSLICNLIKFQQVTAGLMGIGFNLNPDRRNLVQQMDCIGNMIAFGAAGFSMFDTYPAVPMLVGGNRSAGGQYNGSGVPTLTETTGATYVDRNGGTASLTWYVNNGGAWSAVTIP